MKMKCVEVFIFALAVLEAVESRPPRRSDQHQTDSLLYRHDVPWNGRFYSFRFKTTSGISRREQAHLKENPDGVKYLDVEGEYSYPMPDGAIYKVGYKADDSGYHATEHYVANIENENLYDAANSLTSHTYYTKDNTGYQYGNSPHRSENNDKARLLNVYNTQNKDVDRVIFPDELDNNRIYSTEDVTTATAPPTDVTVDNTIDYDELGNRISGVPPAVLASLLGG